MIVRAIGSSHFPYKRLNNQNRAKCQSQLQSLWLFTQIDSFVIQPFQGQNSKIPALTGWNQEMIDIVSRKNDFSSFTV